MTEHDPGIARILDQALPHEFDAPAWELILAESRSPSPRRLPRLTRKKLVLLVALVLLAVLVPLSALGVANDWWIFDMGGNSFGPTGNVITIASVRVESAPWDLIAFETKATGLCFSIAAHGPGSNKTTWQAMLSCSGAHGLSGPTWQPVVSFFSSSVTNKSGATVYIVGGPTDRRVAEVDVVDSDGEAVTTRTIPAPRELGLPIRFFLTKLPPSTHWGSSVKELIARDSAGKVLKRVTYPAP